MTFAEKKGVIFEDEVRRVAAAVWGLEPGDCQPAEYRTDLKLREIDAIVHVNEVLHLVMATSRTDLQKCKDDCDRLEWASNYFSKSNDLIKKWLITKEALQAPHHDYARKKSVTAITLDEFRRRFFDGLEYLRLRSEAPFGSARDPVTNSPKLKADAYVRLPMFWQESGAAEFRQVDIQWLSERMMRGRIIILTAPFGGGKSLTTREIFNRLAGIRKKQGSGPWPLALSLRDHYGQSAGDEILERHARAIGFAKRNQLVAAWRSGTAHLLLDGFDEIGAQAIFQADDRNFMRLVRRQALAGVRSLLTAIPDGVGIFLSGRTHFFDDRTEMATALGLEEGAFDVIRLEEFDEESARVFLAKNGVERQLPDWLPRKPLILSYLLRNKLFDEIVQIDGSRGFAYAWDKFLDRICQREAQLEGSVVEPNTLRNVLERLALLVRSRTSGNGPLYGSDLADAYRLEAGQDPAGSVLTQLQRLPGLAQRDNDPSARSFVDDDMLAALQGSGFARLILGSIDSSDATKAPTITTPIALSELSVRAIEMAAFVLQEAGAASDLVIAKAERFCIDRRSVGGSQNASDAISTAIELARAKGTEALSLKNMLVENAMVGKISGEDVELQNAVFRDCNIAEVVLEGLNGVRFENCSIIRLTGASDASAVPPGVLVNCDVGSFDDMSTNSAIQQLPVSPQFKALLVTLRKLYLQAGAGRKVTALHRGMPANVSVFVDPVLKILQSRGIVEVSAGVVHPVRRQSARIHRILGAPRLSSDDIVADVLKL